MNRGKPVWLLEIGHLRHTPRSVKHPRPLGMKSSESLVILSLFLGLVYHEPLTFLEDTPLTFSQNFGDFFVRVHK
jgi:hypothetical protein